MPTFMTHNGPLRIYDVLQFGLTTFFKTVSLGAFQIAVEMSLRISDLFQHDAIPSRPTLILYIRQNAHGLRSEFRSDSPHF
mgnify:CR=1 FL=1